MSTETAIPRRFAEIKKEKGEAPFKSLVHIPPSAHHPPALQLTQPEMPPVLESQGQPSGDIPPENTALLLFVSPAAADPLLLLACLTWEALNHQPAAAAAVVGQPASRPPRSMSRGAWLAPSPSSTVCCTLTLIYLLLAQGFTPPASTAAFAITY